MSDTDSHDSFLEELEQALDEQRQQKERRVTYRTVNKLHELVPVQEKEINNEVVAIELCVVSVEPFAKGWHYQLTNKAAAGPRFDAAKATLSTFEREKAEKYLFHLTVWQPPKRRRDDRTIPPGTVLFSDAVTGFSLYKLKRQGEATHDSVMKVEVPANEDDISPPKKVNKNDK